MLVYRDERKSRSGRVAVGELRAELARVSDGTAGRECLLAAFLRAGELECAIADSSGDVRAAQTLTDELAAAWLHPERRSSGWDERFDALLADLQPPASFFSKPPEGYAYYGLTPDAYAALAREQDPASSVAIVVGVRSIGTTLSAVVCAALRALGARCVRFTVRPTGHPWDRQLTLSQAQQAAIELGLQSDAQFLVVDEGPGMSGSTLLATADALRAAGVPPERLTLYCSHAPDSAKLLAPHAARRWDELRVRSPRGVPRPGAEDLVDLSGGAWRKWLFSSEAAFPACWVEQERLKFLHAASARFYKFVGLSPYGRRVAERAAVLWQGGFGCEPLAYRDGFLSWRWVSGVPLVPSALSGELIDHMARYCAFRRRHFAVTDSDDEQLTHMARVNVGESLGAELPADFQLIVEAPMCVDGRMLPHEWIADAERDARAPVKVDALDHGDGHLFPGPTDIRWDLAGAVVEWGMDDTQRRLLAERYVRHAGASTVDRHPERLDDYVIGYAAFRVGCLTFAAHSAHGAERARIARARADYERQLVSALRRRGRRVPERHMGQSDADAARAD